MKFAAHVVRLRLEVVEVTVDVPDDGNSDAMRASAKMLAKLKSNSLHEKKWQDWSLLQPASYEPWVTWVASEDDASDDLDCSLEEYANENTPLNRLRYVLLEGDLCGGEGRLVMQPWLSRDRPELLEADLISDWMADLNGLYDKRELIRLDD
ncbi:MAG: hypothetical protein JXQ99_21205 [Hyphomicrobiaceae bacterium]